MLDEALTHARERQAATRATAEYLPDVHALRETALHLMSTVRHELLCISPDASWYTAKPEHFNRAKAVMSRLGAEGVTVRKLYGPSALARLLRLGQYRNALTKEGIRIRITESALHEVMIFDGSVALVRVNHPAGGNHCVAVRSPALLKGLGTLFEVAWGAASDADVYLAFREGDFGEDAAPILRLLSAGYKDDRAARELGLSVRTYRRRVAEIMTKLNATSRFQAGVRAAGLGLM